jgi:hypothetical protein
MILLNNKRIWQKKRSTILRNYQLKTQKVLDEATLAKFKILPKLSDKQASIILLLNEIGLLINDFPIGAIADNGHSVPL